MVPFWQVILYLENGSILAGNIVSREWFAFWQDILYLENGSILAGNIVSREGFHFGR